MKSADANTPKKGGEQAKRDIATMSLDEILLQGGAEREPLPLPASGTTYKPDGVPFTFNIDGNPQILYISSRPLGIIFQERLPLSVKRVKDDSISAVEGVQVGWEIANVDGVDLNHCKSHTEAIGIIQQRMATLPYRNLYRGTSQEIFPVK